MMPGGDKEAYEALEPIVSKVAAQVRDFHNPVTALKTLYAGVLTPHTLLHQQC